MVEYLDSYTIRSYELRYDKYVCIDIYQFCVVIVQEPIARVGAAKSHGIAGVPHGSIQLSLFTRQNTILLIPLTAPRLLCTLHLCYSGDAYI